MGALPSRETHQRGLYSHRHGRNRRTEIILIPLTSTFFPSADCELFQHVYRSRQRRTAKYYYRALRSTETSRESDYYCTTTAINEPSEFHRFNRERLEKESGTTASASAKTGGNATAGIKSSGTAESKKGTQSNETPASTNRTGGERVASDYEYQCFSDTLEGLYQILVEENDLCVFDTDAELREAYWNQVHKQRTDWDDITKRFMYNPANTASNPVHGATGDPSVPFNGTTFENVSFEAFLSGYMAAKRYVKGKGLHTHYSMHDTDEESRTFEPSATPPVLGAEAPMARDPVRTAEELAQINARPQRQPGKSSDSTSPSDGARDGASADATKTTSATGVPKKRVTAPSAYYIRPIPCVIASRYDPTKPNQPVDDPLYVRFEDSYVKIMGMFGVFPSTVQMRHKTGPQTKVGGTRDEDAAAGAQSMSAGERRRFPKKEGSSNADDDMDEDVEVEQHLLKGTMFIDKDVGDQILGNMAMLATFMYVRQAVEAKIKPRHIPMMPFFMRTPLSNIPMLQFIREFRVRLRTLLEAGTAKAGQKPLHTGMSGFNPEDIPEVHHAEQVRLDEEGYLFEDDIPNVVSPKQLFQEHVHHGSASSWPLQRHTGTNTNPDGHFPILMMSGFNVQSTPLRHPVLNATGHLKHISRRVGATAGDMSPSSMTSPATNRTVTGTSGGTSGGGTFTNPTGMIPGVTPLTGGLPLPPPPPPPPPPGAPGAGTPGGAAVPGATNPYQTEARKVALLTRRKNRFRMWVEDGHLCIWASAAYARRACLILAQQLNTTVDSMAVPEHRSWRYRGVLHAGQVVPPPQRTNDVMIVGEDIPAMSLWQGDVLRCCTAEELRASQSGQPLPLPANVVNGNAARGNAPPLTSPLTATTTTAAAAHSKASTGGSTISSPLLPNNSAVPTTGSRQSSSVGAASPFEGADPTAVGTHVNYTSNHISNPLLREQDAAPPGAFWVRGSGGLDDSYHNITASNVPPNPKQDKQQQQAVMQRAKKAAAAAAAALHLKATSGPQQQQLAAVAAGLLDPSLFEGIDRREGTLNVEEVVLSWIKVVTILTRDATEADREWVRDPDGNPVRIDRYVIRRLEYDGVRFFVGLTPRFVGQQRRIEKVLGEVYATEQREAKRDGEEGRGSTSGGRTGAAAGGFNLDLLKQMADSKERGKHTAFGAEDVADDGAGNEAPFTQEDLLADLEYGWSSNSSDAESP